MARAKRMAEFEPAFAKIIQAGAGAVLVSGGPFFGSPQHSGAPCCHGAG
jgi:hypothetical protein